MKPIRTPTSKRTVRLIFAATAVWIGLLQYCLFGLVGAEPYPSLILPGFPAQCPDCPLEGGVPTATVPTVFVRFADGRTRPAAWETVLPPGPSVRLVAFSHAFRSQSVAADPAAVDYLKAWAARQFPDETPSGVDIVWRKAKYTGGAIDPMTTYTPLQTIRIEFGAVK